MISTPRPSRSRCARSERSGWERRENSVREVEDDDAGRSGVDGAKVAPDRVCNLCEGAGHLNSGRPRANDGEGQRSTLGGLVLFEFGLLERQEKPSANIGRLVDGLESWGVLLPIIVPEVVGLEASGEHEVVVGVGLFAKHHVLVPEIDAIDLVHEHSAVLLPAHHAANRSGDRPRMERCGGDLVEEGLKEMVIVLVDHHDVRIRPSQCASGRHTGKPASNDDDTWFRGVHGRVLAPPAPSRKRGMLRP